MVDTYVIDTVFKAHDQMSSTVERVTNRMNIFGRRAEKNLSTAAFAATKFKTVFTGVLGANLISAGLGRIRQGVSGLTEEFISFDHAITSAASKFKFGRGTQQFEELSRAARDVAAVTPYSAAQAGQALDYLAMAGFGAQQSMSSLKGITDLAIAGNMDLAQASDIASDALGALNLMSDDSNQLATNLDRVNDVMAMVAMTANTDIPMLWESLKPVASVAEGLGGNIEELGAMFGTLASSGVKAETSGTALRNMYLRLTGGTREVTKVLDKFGVSIEDSSGKMRPMMDILDEVSKKTANLDDAARQAAYSHLFGARAVNSATILMKAGRDAVGEYQKRLEGASGAASELARRMGESVENRLKALKSRLIEIGLSMVDTFRDKIPGALDDAQAALDRIDPAAVIEGIRNIWQQIQKYSSLLEALVAGLVIYNATMKLAAAAQWALNVAMGANPIGILITSFAILGATIYTVYQNWDTLKSQFNRDLQDISQWLMEFRKKNSFILKMLFGLEEPSDAAMEKMHKEIQQREEALIAKQAEQPGYILTGSGAAVVEKKEEGESSTEKQLKKIFKNLEKTNNVAFRQIEKVQQTETVKTEYKMPNIKLGESAAVKPEQAAAPQKVQIQGEFNFKNPPQGMTFTQETKGAPEIKHNLGAN